MGRMGIWVVAAASIAGAGRAHSAAAVAACAPNRNDSPAAASVQDTAPAVEPTEQQGTLQGPEDQATWQLGLRVTADAGEGRFVVDRGARDGLALGDVVVFTPRAGGEHQGLVREVFDERAVVELPVGTPGLATGTRGTARVRRPRARSAPPTPAVQKQVEGTPAPRTEGTSPSAEAPVEHAPWSAADDDWTPDLPLLAGVGAVRPERRERRFNGRVWTTFDGIAGLDGDRSDSLLRSGADVVVENPFGHGGTLSVEGELVGRRTAFDDDSNADDTSDTALRVDRFSYEVGGTRFDPERWTFGRFLSRDLPEVGVQDGVEWSRRTAEGHRYGLSAAFLPEPDGNLDGSSDFGLSGFYHWVDGVREETLFGAGFQKSFHDGESDRDLVVLRARHLPDDGWTLLATAWLDLHVGDDVDSGLALTELHASAGRRFDGRHDLRVTYDHREYPELLRDEFTPVSTPSLADGAVDRVAISGSAALRAGQRVFGHAGGWADEDDGGGDFELGYESGPVFYDGARLRLAGFVSSGRTSSLRGANVALRGSRDRFAWELGYEVQQDSFDGFETLNDDAVQHRVWLRGDVFTRSGWTFAVNGEVQLQDIEDVVLFGFHLGRSF
jgi:hypothetical protein